jgi:hypothetical protein
MKKTNQTNNTANAQQMPMTQMGSVGIPPINGYAYTQDGKPETFPQPVVGGGAVTQISQAQPGMPVVKRTQVTGPLTQEYMDSSSDEDVDVATHTNAQEVDEAAKEQFKNALVSLLGEDNATEELLNQLEGIFEAAVQDRVNYHVEQTVAQLDENVKVYLDNVTTTLVEKVDDYLDYVVEEWMTENTIAVEQGIKTQIAENFISGLKNLFENHYIDVPAEKYNALDEIYAQNRQLEQNLNSAINENINLRKEMSLTECATVFVAETRDLADTQVAKLQSLMENVAFGGPEEYREKLLAIKNNYLLNQNYVRPQPQQITEEVTFSAVQPIENNTVENYANVIGKLNRKL